MLQHLCASLVVVDYNKVSAGELYGSRDPGSGGGGCGDLENGAPIQNPSVESHNILKNLMTQCSWCEQITQWRRSQSRSGTIALPYTPLCQATDANLHKAVSKSRLQHSGVRWWRFPTSLYQGRVRPISGSCWATCVWFFYHFHLYSDFKGPLAHVWFMMVSRRVMSIGGCGWMTSAKTRRMFGSLASGSSLQQTCWPHTLIPSELWPLLRNSATDLTGRAPINDLGGMEVILSTDTAVVLCTSVDREYLVVKLHSSPANSSTEICEVEKFRDTVFIPDKPISSFSGYYCFKISVGGDLLVTSDFLYCT